MVSHTPKALLQIRLPRWVCQSIKMIHGARHFLHVHTIARCCPLRPKLLGTQVRSRIPLHSLTSTIRIMPRSPETPSIQCTPLCQRRPLLMTRCCYYMFANSKRNPRFPRHGFPPHHGKSRIQTLGGGRAAGSPQTQSINNNWVRCGVFKFTQIQQMP